LIEAYLLNIGFRKSCLSGHLHHKAYILLKEQSGCGRFQGLARCKNVYDLADIRRRDIQMCHQTKATGWTNSDAIAMHASGEQFDVKIASVHEYHIRLGETCLIPQITQAILQQFRV
jgi:hypothetical protein